MSSRSQPAKRVTTTPVLARGGVDALGAGRACRTGEARRDRMCGRGNVSISRIAASSDSWSASLQAMGGSSTHEAKAQPHPPLWRVERRRPPRRHPQSRQGLILRPRLAPRPSPLVQPPHRASGPDESQAKDATHDRSRAGGPRSVLRQHAAGRRVGSRRTFHRGPRPLPRGYLCLVAQSRPTACRAATRHVGRFRVRRALGITSPARQSHAGVGGDRARAREAEQRRCRVLGRLLALHSLQRVRQRGQGIALLPQEGGGRVGRESAVHAAVRIVYPDAVHNAIHTGDATVPVGALSARAVHTHALNTGYHRRFRRGESTRAPAVVPCRQLRCRLRTTRGKLSSPSPTGDEALTLLNRLSNGKAIASSRVGLAAGGAAPHWAGAGGAAARAAAAPSREAAGAAEIVPTLLVLGATHTTTQAPQTFDGPPPLSAPPPPPPSSPELVVSKPPRRPLVLLPATDGASRSGFIWSKSSAREAYAPPPRRLTAPLVPPSSARQLPQASPSVKRSRAAAGNTGEEAPNGMAGRRQLAVGGAGDAAGGWGGGDGSGCMGAGGGGGDGSGVEGQGGGGGR
eukprot:scaffold9106_cov118-Isochrysis_galbana.AAC.1